MEFFLPHPERYPFAVLHTRSLPFVQASDLDSSERVVGVWSCPGTGKTTAIAEYIAAKSDVFPQTVVVTPRRTLAESLVARFDSPSARFAHYGDLRGDGYHIVASGTPRVVVQVESIHRLRGYCDSPLLLIIDESDSVLSQLASTFTHTSELSVSRHADSLEAFVRLLRHAMLSDLGGKVIMCDAFFSDNALDSLAICGCTSMALYRYTTMPEPRLVVRVPVGEVERELPFLQAVEACILRGQRAFVFSSSKSVVRSLRRHLESSLGGRFFEPSNGSYYEATGDDVGAPLSDADAVWGSCRLVVVTSRVTVGVNFTLRNHFDAVFCHVSSFCGNRVRDVFQAIFRVRHPKSPHLYVQLVGPVDDAAPDYRSCVETVRAAGTLPLTNASWELDARDQHLYSLGRLLAAIRSRDPVTNLPRLLLYRFLEQIAVRDEQERALSVHRIRETWDVFADLCGFQSEKAPETLPSVWVPRQAPASVL